VVQFLQLLIFQLVKIFPLIILKILIMKTSILMTFSILIITTSLTGQTKSFKYQFEHKNPGPATSNSPLPPCQVNNLNGHFKPENIEKSSNMIADFHQNSFVQVPYKYEPYSKNPIPERGPNTHRFNGNMPYIKPGPHWNMPIKQPDTTVKYYLIIKGVPPCRPHK
jgi:hypothetical protein